MGRIEQQPNFDYGPIKPKDPKPKDPSSLGTPQERAIRLRIIIDKKQKGEKLTHTEQELFDSQVVSERRNLINSTKDDDQYRYGHH